MAAPFPADDPAQPPLRHDPDAEAHMALVMAVITGVRNIRGEMNIAPSVSLAATVQSADERLRQLLTDYREIIANLARLSAFETTPPGPQPPSAAAAVIEDATIYVSLEGIIDFDKEIERLEKETGKLQKELKGISKKLSNEDFLDKAPEAVIQKAKDRHESLAEKRQKLQENLDRIRSMAS
jgi:valyl-tRNA synthetase